MADPVRERIEEALLGLEIEVKQQTGSKGYEMAYPGTVAEFVYDCLRQAPAVISPKPDAGPWIADSEIGIISRTVTDLDVIDDGESAGQTHGAIWRVLSYLASRYGYVLATED